MRRKEIISNPLPNNLETEKAVIGALLVESDAISEVVSMLKPETFYDESLGMIYSVIAGLYSENIKPDMITVTKSLMKSRDLDKVGGPFALSMLSGYIASATNIVEHAQYLHQLWLARSLAVVGMEIAAKAVDPTVDIDDTITGAIKSVEGIAENTDYNSRMSDISFVAKQCIDSYQMRKEKAKNGQDIGITTGLSKLDQVTGGWKPGQLIILAARPGMGKTALLLHFAKSAAMKGTPIAIFSLEMGGISLTDRLILSECNIDSDRYKFGQLSGEEESMLCNAVNNISFIPISVEDTPNISIQQIKVRARNLQRKGKCGFILIDYLQLIDMRSSNKSYNREQEVSQCSRAAKVMAKELGVPVVLLSQLSRKSEERSDKMPLLSDLRESGAIEQDADIVMFIHRPEYYNKTAEKGLGEIRIAKQRDGATGDIRFWYNHNLTKIADYEQQMPF